MPNPTGKNQLPGGKKELPYGGVQQAQQLTKAAPLSGAPTSGSALNAPRRAHSAAVKGKRAGAQKAQEPKVLERPKDAFHPTSAPPPDQPTSQSVAESWAEISQIPGVSPLVHELATRALSGLR